MSVPADVTWFGDRAVLVSSADRDSGVSLARTLSAAFPELVVRQGMRSVLVEAPAPSAGIRDLVLDVVRTAAGQPDSPNVDSRVVDVVLRYDGPDLASAANALGLTPDELAARHSAQPWRVAMMGFAPGFGYLVPEGEWCIDWSALTRRREPRAEVPRGSVAIAAGMSAIYPARMPGGWHLIGHTDAEVFNADRRTPALLAPDDIVRFRVDA